MNFIALELPKILVKNYVLRMYALREHCAQEKNYGNTNRFLALYFESYRMLWMEAFNAIHKI